MATRAVKLLISTMVTGNYVESYFCVYVRYDGDIIGSSVKYIIYNAPQSPT